MLLALDVGKLEAALLPALEEEDPNYTVRELLTDFADANGVPL